MKQQNENYLFSGKVLTKAEMELISGGMQEETHLSGCTITCGGGKKHITTNCDQGTADSVCGDFGDGEPEYCECQYV